MDRVNEKRTHHCRHVGSSLTINSHFRLIYFKVITKI